MTRLALAALLAVPALLLSTDAAKANGPWPFNYGVCGTGHCSRLFDKIHQHGPLFNYGPYYGYYPFEPYGPWDAYLRYNGGGMYPGAYGYPAGGYSYPAPAAPAARGCTNCAPGTTTPPATATPAPVVKPAGFGR